MSDQFRGHIGPLWKFREAAAAVVVINDVLEADSVIYNDYFYYKEIGFPSNYGLNYFEKLNHYHKLSFAAFAI